MRPDFPPPEFLEQVQAAVKEGPAWWVYLAFVVLSFLGATLGFQYVGPGERIGKVEVRVDTIQARQRAHELQDTMLVRWMCVKSTPTERQYVGLRCQ